MNGQATAKAIDPRHNVLPIFGNVLPEDKRPSWIIRAAMFLGVIMANPETPRGWSWNPATITLTLTVAGMIAFGGWYVGVQQEKYNQMNERLQKAEDDARRRAMLEAARSNDAHEPGTQEMKKENKPNGR